MAPTWLAHCGHCHQYGGRVCPAGKYNSIKEPFQLPLAARELQPCPRHSHQFRLAAPAVCLSPASRHRLAASLLVLTAKLRLGIWRDHCHNVAIPAAQPLALGAAGCSEPPRLDWVFRTESVVRVVGKQRNNHMPAKACTLYTLLVGRLGRLLAHATLCHSCILLAPWRCPGLGWWLTTSTLPSRIRGKRHSGNSAWAFRAILSTD